MSGMVFREMANCQVNIPRACYSLRGFAGHHCSVPSKKRSVVYPYFRRMSLLSGHSLFAVVVALAVIPSARIALVVARSGRSGFRSGVAVAGGIALGDLIFIALALLGLSAIAESMGTLFAVFRYLGGAYLIWLGFSLIRSRKGVKMELGDNRRSTLLASFAAGLFLTLGDVKAIFFYASLFPSFVDMAVLSAVEIVSVVLITILGVGGVKVAYAFFARKIVERFWSKRIGKTAEMTAGGLFAGLGTYLLVKT